MADKKISALTAAGALTGTEEVEVVQGGVNVKTTPAAIAALGGGGGAWGSITGTLSSQTDLQAALDAKALLYPTINNETANYNAALTDAGNFIEMDSASPSTMTVPPQSSVVWLANTELTVVNYGAGDVTLTPGAGVTFRNLSGGLLNIPQYGVAVLKRKASDEWYVFNRSASTNLASGTYTPTLTNTTNVAASTAYINNYMRVGSSVTVSGHVDIDPTTTGSTVLGMSLPVASAFGTVDQLGGVAASSGVAGIAIAILANATNDRATFQYIAVDTTNQTFYFTFTYTVL